MRTLIRISALLLLAACVSHANAQTGPSRARVLNTSFRSRAAKPPSMEHWALVQFRIDANGHLVDGNIVESSGDEAFDREAVTGLSASLSGVPEIDANGEVLTTGKVKLGYGNNKRALNKPADAPAPSEPAKTQEEIAEAEGARILRMRCKDFLWEYDLMKSLYARVAEESMPQTAMAVYASRAHLSEKSIKKVARVGKKGIPASAEACRLQPDAMFVETVLTPTLDALMK